MKDHWYQYGIESPRHVPQLSVAWFVETIMAVVPLAAAAQQAAEEARESFLDGVDREQDDDEFEETHTEKLSKVMADQAAGFMKINRELVEAFATERTKAEQARVTAYHWEQVAKTSMQESRMALLKAAKWEARFERLQGRMQGLARMYREQKLRNSGLEEILDMLNHNLESHHKDEDSGPGEDHA